MAPASLSMITGIMAAFADFTGRSGERSPRRYLGTDAFAFCNYLELYRQTTNRAYLNLAQNLVAQIHQVLGRHRADDDRRGWISGLAEEEGRKHPIAGGAQDRQGDA